MFYFIQLHRFEDKWLRREEIIEEISSYEKAFYYTQQISLSVNSLSQELYNAQEKIRRICDVGETVQLSIWEYEHDTEHERLAGSMTYMPKPTK